MLKKIFILGSVFLLTACHSSLNKMTLLRSPEKLTHAYSYEEVNEQGYLSFKDKLKEVSSQLSESVIKREFKDNGNITLSPLSIELCLGLAVSASSGTTREELLNIFDMDFVTFNKYYKTYYNQMSLERYGDDNKLMSQQLLTNSIWIDSNIKLFDKGLDDLMNDYYCYSYQADFRNDNEKSNKAIEEFISDKTKGLIKPKLQFSPDTLFVLMNTLYLKDIWNNAGIELTYAEDEYKFTNRDGQVSSKKLLDPNKYLTGKALVTDNFSSFYTSTLNGFKITFIKPNNGKDLKDIFTASNINYAINKDNYIYKDDTRMEKYHTKCIFPEYKAECDVELKDIIREDYHVNTLFDSGSCDFSSLTQLEVFISSIKHIAKLEVNKKGIEGAAVTLMMGEATSIGDPDPYQHIYEIFPVDQEFGFVITYQDAVIFSGTVTNID